MPRGFRRRREMLMRAMGILSQTVKAHRRETFAAIPNQMVAAWPACPVD
jgi:hypothetical protein